MVDSKGQKFRYLCLSSLRKFFSQLNSEKAYSVIHLFSSDILNFLINSQRRSSEPVRFRPGKTTAPQLLRGVLLPHFPALEAGIERRYAHRRYQNRKGCPRQTRQAIWASLCAKQTLQASDPVPSCLLRQGITGQIARTMAEVLAPCQYGVFSLFGTIWITYFALQLWRSMCLLRSRGLLDGVVMIQAGSGEGGKATKQHHGQLEMSLSSIYTFVGECSVFCAILFFAYCCEQYPLHPAEERLWDRDTFYFLMIVFVLGCILTIKEGKQTDILNRDQTEEWKGWMQVSFPIFPRLLLVSFFASFCSVW